MILEVARTCAEYVTTATRLVSYQCYAEGMLQFNLHSSDILKQTFVLQLLLSTLTLDAVQISCALAFEV